MAGCNSGNVANTALLTSSACQANASGNSATAVGVEAVASGSVAIAVGRLAKATGDGSVVLGFNADATAVGATTVGTAATASNANATSVGQVATAAGRYSTAVGAGAVIPGGARALASFTVAIGGGDTTTDGEGALATGAYGIAIGNGAQAGGRGTAVGSSSQALSPFATAFGTKARANTGLAPTAVGTDSSAAGENAAAFGRFAGATQPDSTALGSLSNATRNASTAVGIRSKAVANNATAVGASSEASAGQAVALGRGARAIRARSVALGSGSVANAADTVSVGKTGSERRITNVAAAVKATDAVNLRQVRQMLKAATAASFVAVPARTAAASRKSNPRSVKAAALTTETLGPNAAPSADRKGPYNRRSDATDPPSRNAPGSDARGNERSPGSAAAERSEALEPSTIVGWANVKSDGALARGRNITDSVRHGAGEYEIAFAKTPLRRCTYNATLSGVGFVSVKPGSLANSLKVETRNHYGVLSDAAFHLMAVC